MMEHKSKALLSSLEHASNKEIARMANETATWYKALFLQSIRWFNSMKEHEDTFKLPWDLDGVLPSNTERLFWIIALDHVLDSIEDLNYALMARNDNRLDLLAHMLLEEDNLRQQIRDLRNKNEHHIDYRLGVGNKPDTFESIVNTELGSFKINAHWFLGAGKDCYIGGIDCMKTLKHMREYRNEIILCLEKIFIEYWR